MHETLTQCLAFDQFTGNVVSGVILPDLVNGQDIWMIERHDGVRFLLKALQTAGSPAKRVGRILSAALTARCNVGGEIDFAHPTAADPFTNFVVADRMADERISLPILNNPRRETDS